MSDYQIDAEEMDNIAHALGRPKTAADIPNAYRNYYACGFDGPTSHRFAQSPAWDWSHTVNRDPMLVWYVTDWGKAKLAEHLDGQ